MTFLFLSTSTGLKKKDITLLASLLADSPDGSTVADLFRRFDVDAIRQERTSLLSQLCIKANYVGVPQKHLAKMKGFSKYMVAHNARQIMHFLELARQYTEAGIPILLCKGIAMRLGYMTNQTRHMWDVDIAVSPACYASSLAIARRSGYQCKPTIHASTLEKDQGMPIDVHTVFHKTSISGVDESQVWQRGRKIKVRGVELRLPCVEDMLMQIMTNEFSNLVIEGEEKPHLKWVYDAGWLIQHNNVDWDMLFAIASEYRVAHTIKFMLLLLNDILPGIVDTKKMHLTLPGYENDKKLIANYHRSIHCFRRYFRAKRSKNIAKYIWYWPAFVWHHHSYYHYGLSFAKRLALFPIYLKTYFGATSWLEFPVAALKMLDKRMQQDKGAL